MIGREGLDRQVLLDLFEKHGATDAVSYISTGNIGFTAAPNDLERLIDDVEASVASVIGRLEPLIVRTLDRLVEIAAGDPFDRPELEVQDRLVSFTRRPVSLDIDLPVIAEKGDHAILEATGAEVYSVTLEGVGRIRSPGGFVEKLVGDPVTTRSWNTVQRVVSKETGRG
jgi:uncharacterized protein (DUF1697 family)